MLNLLDSGTVPFLSYQDTSGPVCAGGASPRGGDSSARGGGGRPGRESEEVPEPAQPAPPPPAQEGQVGTGAHRGEGQSSR